LDSAQGVKFGVRPAQARAHPHGHRVALHAAGQVLRSRWGKARWARRARWGRTRAGSCSVTMSRMAWRAKGRVSAKHEGSHRAAHKGLRRGRARRAVRARSFAAEHPATHHGVSEEAVARPAVATRDARHPWLTTAQWAVSGLRRSQNQVTRLPRPRALRAAHIFLPIKAAATLPCPCLRTALNGVFNVV
jgi:hypothetical protein